MRDVCPVHPTHWLDYLQRLMPTYVYHVNGTRRWHILRENYREIWNLTTVEGLRLSRVIIKLAPINYCVLIRTAAFIVHGCAKWMVPCYLVCGLTARRVRCCCPRDYCYRTTLYPLVFTSGTVFFFARCSWPVSLTSDLKMLISSFQLWNFLTPFSTVLQLDW